MQLEKIETSHHTMGILGLARVARVHHEQGNRQAVQDILLVMSSRAEAHQLDAQHDEKCKWAW